MFTKKPRIKIISDGVIREDGTMKIELDWNKEFLKTIQEQGADGSTEEEVVNQFLIYMLRCLIKPPAETPPLASDSKEEITPTDDNNDIIQ